MGVMRCLIGPDSHIFSAMQVTCKDESLLLYSDHKTVNSWIESLTKAISLVMVYCFFFKLLFF
jgi:hypothetical protein